MAKRRERKGGLVYSTDQGRMCPGCQRPQAECVCNDRSRARPGASAGGAVIVSRETKGRKGAGVTLIKGLPLADKDLADKDLADKDLMDKDLADKELMPPPKQQSPKKSVDDNPTDKLLDSADITDKEGEAEEV